MEQDRTADTAAPPITSDAAGLADASLKIGDLHIDERERISYTRDRILQIREDTEISEDILKVNQLIEAEFDDTKSEELHFQGRERICYSIHQLLRLQKVAKIPEGIWKIKKEFDVETKHPAPSTPSDLIAKAGCLIQQEQMVEYPQRPGELECLYFKKYGTCGFRSACRFHHPLPSALGDPTMDGDDSAHRREKMEYSEISGEPECPSFMEFGSCNFGATCKYHHPKDHLPIMASCNISRSDLPFTPASASPSFSDFSGSPPETDNLLQQSAQMEDCTWSRGQSECTYFMKFGTCKFGSTCKYKHTQSSTTTGSSLVDGPIQRPTHMDYTERHHQSDSLSPGKPVCSYFIKYGTCKFESACKFHHPSPSTLTYLTTKADGPIHHEGQLDEYPQRPGEPECSYFIKHGTCKFKSACKFHHPSPSTLRGPTVKVDDPAHREQREEYPQRPGEPECSHFIKYGTCKFESACKFHHPSPSTLGGLTTEANVWVRHQGHSEIPGEADCIISPAGLPLRPGRPSCSYYSRFGTCKFGPQCRFDHPMDNASSVPATDSKYDESER